MATISQLMNRDIKVVPYDTTIEDSADKMSQWNISSLLIEREGQVAGIVTDTDIVRKAVAKQLRLDQGKIGELMSRPVVSLEQDRSVEDAFDLMGESRVRHLAVTDRGNIIGIISVRDLLVFFRKESEPKMGID